MIIQGTNLYIIDNSGVKKAKCIKILYRKCKFASIGDIVKITTKKISRKSKIKKGEIFYSLIINTKYNKRINNQQINIKFNKNCAIILDNKLDPIGTRISGIVPKIFKNTIFKKILSLANKTI
ncbi:MAG: uL14 family ribosomal protein [Candidatus Vidania fulgoroideorum]